VCRTPGALPLYVRGAPLGWLDPKTNQTSVAIWDGTRREDVHRATVLCGPSTNPENHALAEGAPFLTGQKGGGKSRRSVRSLAEGCVCCAGRIETRSPRQQSGSLKQRFVLFAPQPPPSGRQTAQGPERLRVSGPEACWLWQEERDPNGMGLDVAASDDSGYPCPE
jgi:hypothetical protein